MACGEDYIGRTVVKFPFSVSDFDSDTINAPVPRSKIFGKPIGFTYYVIQIRSKISGYLQLKSEKIEEGDLVKLVILPCGPSSIKKKIKTTRSVKNVTEIGNSLQNGVSSKLASSLSSKIASKVASTTGAKVGTEGTGVSEELSAELSSEIASTLQTEVTKSVQEAISSKTVNEVVSTTEHEEERLIENKNTCHRKEIHFYQLYLKYSLRLAITGISVNVKIIKLKKVPGMHGPSLQQTTLLDVDLKHPLKKELEIFSSNLRLPLAEPCPHTFMKPEPGCCPPTLDKNSTTTEESEKETDNEKTKTSFGPSIPFDPIFERTNLELPFLFNENYVDFTPTEETARIMEEVIDPLYGLDAKKNKTLELSKLEAYISRVRNPNDPLNSTLYLLDSSIDDFLPNNLQDKNIQSFMDLVNDSDSPDKTETNFDKSTNFEKKPHKLQK